MRKKIWRFSPFDTMFFRESRPMSTIGGSELQSLFPPPSRTMAGAIRTAIGDHNKVDWKNYKNSEKYKYIREEIGIGDDMKNLKLSGPWLVINKGNQWARLYPVPAHLKGKWENGKLSKIVTLSPDKFIRCDLGKKILIVTAPENEQGIKPLDEYWIKKDSLKTVLAGNPLTPDNLIHRDEIFAEEPRLGIARNNQSRSAKKGMLYQTKHIRTNHNVAIEMKVSGITKDIQPQSGVTRLGGEGRGAAFEVIEMVESKTNTIDDIEDAKGIMLITLSPLPVEVDKNQETIFLPNFKKNKTDQTTWSGTINGKQLTLVSSAIGKNIREGGWNMEISEPRAVKSFIPCGSVFYCKVKVNEGSIKDAVQGIHMKQIGNKEDRALGRGLVAAGYWR